NVPLNLRRARLDRVAARTEITISPHSVIDRVAVRPFELAVRSEQFLRYLLQPLVQFAPHEFLNRTFRTRDAGRGKAAERTHLVEAHDLDLGVTLRQFLPDDRILCGWTTVSFNAARQLDQSLDVAAIDHLESGAECRALVHQRPHGNFPA